MTKFRVFLISVVLATGSQAQGRKPQKSDPVKNVKDGANQALDNVDKAVHEALPAVKNAANKGLKAVDDGVHKIIHSDKK